MHHVSTLIILENDHTDQVAIWPEIQKWPEWQTVSFQHPDVHWYNWGPWAEDETPNLKIETVREVIEALGFGGYQGSQRLYLINRVDTAGVPAQNALLKTVEEPPAGTRIVLTAIDESAVLPTILSRCVVIRLGTTTPAQFETQAESEAATLYHQIRQSSISQVIELTDQWGNDRGQAVQRLTQLSIYLLSRLTAHPDPVVTAHLTAVTTALNQLKQNSTVKLTLDQCWFALQK